MLYKFLDICRKVKSKLNVYKTKIGAKNRNKMLKNKNVTIISNNCFAGITYEYLDLPYTSPTIGLYFFADDYLKFIKNLKKYINAELRELKPQDSKYYSELIEKHQENKVLGKLLDIEIVFLHYNSFEEAKSKWEKRCKRINYNNIIYKFNDQNNCTREHLIEFNKLKLKNKICFTAKKYDYKDFIHIKKYQKYTQSR